MARERIEILESFPLLPLIEIGISELHINAQKRRIARCIQIHIYLYSIWAANNSFEWQKINEGWNDTFLKRDYQMHV